MAEANDILSYLKKENNDLKEENKYLKKYIAILTSRTTASGRSRFLAPTSAHSDVHIRALKPECLPNCFVWLHKGETIEEVVDSLILRGITNLKVIKEVSEIPDYAETKCLIIPHELNTGKKRFCGKKPKSYGRHVVDSTLRLYESFIGYDSYAKMT